MKLVTFKAYATVMAAMVLSACQTGAAFTGNAYKDYVQGPTVSQGAMASLTASSPSGVKQALAAVSSDDRHDTATVMAIVSKASVDTQANAARMLILESDRMCDIYMSTVLGSSREITSVMELAGVGLGLAGGVAAPVDSSNLLSVLSAGTAGIEPALTKTILGDHSAASIYRAVMVQRKTEQARLAALLDSGQMSGMTVMTELADYHASCGVVNGQNALDAAIESANRNAQAEGQKRADEQLELLDQTGKP